jgi:GT2 family glycosyltransferase
MELSILVPVYNFDIKSLVLCLAEEINQKYQGDIEIVVLDDCSTEQNLAVQNQRFLENFDFVKYIPLSNNIGRSKARNYLSKISRASHFLFLDCDVLPDREDFLEKYVESIKNNDFVVCGGISYQQIQEKSNESTFYLEFSKKTDVHDSSYRNDHSWQTFLSSNFLVNKNVIERFPFDETYSGYGYEDLDWAATLQKNGIRVFHVENTVTHIGLVSDSHFLSRAKLAIQNYVKFSKKYPDLFAETKIYKILLALKFCPEFVLNFLKSVFDRLINLKDLPFIFRYNAFQFLKAVLFELELRKSKQ